MIRQQNSKSKDILAKRSNVLFSEMPVLLRDIITPTIEAAPEFRIVGNIGRDESPLEAITRTDADVVIAMEGIVTREEYADILYTRPSVKVVEIMSNGRYGAIYELQPRRVHLGELSQSWLLHVLRASAGHLRFH